MSAGKLAFIHPKSLLHLPCVATSRGNKTMSRKTAPQIRMFIAMTLAILAVPVDALDRAAAKLAVQASVATIPGDAAVFDYRGRHIHIADLDGDGVDEIVALVSATCSGLNADCPNYLIVLTALDPDDERFRLQAPGVSPVFDAQLAAVRDSGYDDGAVEQIPGDVQ